MHIVRLHALGITRDSRQAFTMLVKAGVLDSTLGKRLEAMVGFRNIAIHNYTEINIDIVRSMLNERLVVMKLFFKLLIKFSFSEE